MLLVGLTGGYASGKSTVAQVFKACGAKVIDADALARQVVQPGKPAWKAIVKRFGRSVLAPDGTINRDHLARVVFSNPTKLKSLTNIIHPRVAREQARLTRSIAAKHPNAVIIYDAALLIEAGAHDRMDKILVVTADRNTQLDRACRRDRISKAQAARRLRHQLPLRQKIRYADYVIDGTLPLRQLRKTIRTLYGEFRNLARTAR